MKFRPILFSTYMVQALLDNRKNMTRRTKGLEIINENPNMWRFDGLWDDGDDIADNGFYFEELDDKGKYKEDYKRVNCPYGNIGDVLWVRESISKFSFGNTFLYKTDETESGEIIKWKPSIHMPKKACRLFLEITNIRCERLMDITEDDAKNEGVISWFNILFKETSYKDYTDDDSWYRSPITSFLSLWQKINGVDSWKANPWVWVIEFKQIENHKILFNN